MHIEKNVFDNIFGTVLGIKGKTKDDAKAREGLKELGIRKDLWYDASMGSKIPRAPYTVSPEERAEIFRFIRDAKYPSGYAGSLKSKINMDDKKFNGLKTHDCHVMLQRLLPVFVRPFLPHNVIHPLISLSRWFQKLCCKELTVSDVTQMKGDIVIILCKLEMIFPPAFFTIMVHLLVHLPDQVLLKGPVNYCWMYPIERQLAQYKRSVRNTRYPEGCIAEQHIIQECVMYCRLYINDSIGELNQMTDAPTYELNVWSPLVKVSGPSPGNKLTKREVEKAHWCVVENCAQAKYFVEQHQAMYELRHPNGSKMSRVKHFRGYFNGWMGMLEGEGSNFYSTELHSLSRMPQAYVCYSQCEVNGVKFVVSARDERKKTQNSGVMVEDGLFTYYGIVNDIIELHYANGMPVVVFDCQWYNNDPTERGSTKKDYGLCSVDTSTKWYQDWPYCLATTAGQVFYLEDLKAGEPWKVVNVVSHRGMYSEASLAREVEYIEDDTDHPYQEQFPSDIEEPNQDQTVNCHDPNTDADNV